MPPANKSLTHWMDALATTTHEVAHVLAQLGSTSIPVGRSLSLTQLVRTVWRDTQRHQVQAFAGDLTYNATLAMIPFILFVVLVLRSVHADVLLTGALDVFSAVLPAASARLLRSRSQQRSPAAYPTGGFWHWARSGHVPPRSVR